MKKPHEDWLEYAQEDLNFGRSGLQHGFYNHVCVLAQQAVEKALKGYLVFQGKSYPKSHDLVDLHRRLDVDWLHPHLHALKSLADFYVPLRYPDAFGTLPGGPPDRATAEKALRWSTEIVELIRSKI